MLYHSNSTGPDVQAFKDAFKKCHQLALVSNKEMKITVHTKNQLEGNVIEDALGKDFVKALLNKSVPIQGVTIHLETERKQINTSMVVLAPHISFKYLEKIIENNTKSDIVYLPWAEEELKEYLKKYSVSTSI
jgi:hypothetical protein